MSTFAQNKQKVLDTLFAFHDTLRMATIYRLGLDGKVAVRGWLIRQGRTQIWLAAQLGIDDTLLSRMLAGSRPVPPDVVRALRRITKIDMAQFTEAA
jgi:hypothetical protein